MKKLVASGFKNIFQICKCFRDHESWGGLHNTEFTMIEWYQTPADLADVMDMTEKMFKFVAGKIDINNLTYRNCEINMAEKWDRKTMKQLFEEYLNKNLDNLLTIDKLANFAQTKGYVIGQDYSYEDIFYKIFLNDIEPRLGMKRPIFVYDYPAQMCSLSKPSANKGYAQRTELYIAGMELANAFGELTDSKQQEINLLQDQTTRERLGKEVYDIDKEFVNSLAEIKTKLAGIALGIDRMVLLFSDTDEINEVIFQSVGDQIDNNKK